MGQIAVDATRCKGCGRCIVACPKDLIDFSKDLNDRGRPSRRGKAKVAPPHHRTSSLRFFPHRSQTFELPAPTRGMTATGALA